MVFRRPKLDVARTGAVVFSAALVVAALSACTPVEAVIGEPLQPTTGNSIPGAAPSQTPGAQPSDAPSTDPSAGPSESPSSGPSAPAAPGKTTKPAPTFTPVNLNCTDLISLDAMYDFNPNFGTDPSYAPASGSLAATIADYDGLTCGWVNQSSGETIEAAVAHPDGATLTNLKNKAITVSNPVPLYGDEGYFRTVAGVGEAQAFSGPYWLVLRSSSFLEPGEAAGLVNAAISSLP